MKRMLLKRIICRKYFRITNRRNLKDLPQFNSQLKSTTTIGFVTWFNIDCKTVGFFFADSLAKARSAESVENLDTRARSAREPHAPVSHSLQTFRSRTAHSYDQRKKYDCFAVKMDTFMTIRLIGIQLYLKSDIL